MFDVFKKQFIEVIDWTESENGILAYRFPTLDKEIQTGAKLTVRESQTALFVNEGNLADTFSPGLYTLTTKTLPVLTALMNWDKGFKSPFKSDVYFFSTREQLDQRWGTQQPITVRDGELGIIRLRAFGSFSYRIEEPSTFFQKISGTREQYSASELDGQLRAIIATEIATTLGDGKTPFLEAAANQSKLSETLKIKLDSAFWDYGLKLTSFYVQSITLPEELQQYLDKQSSVNLVGDLKKYAQFQAADSISAAAQNPGGFASAGVGIGIGNMLGQTLADSGLTNKSETEKTDPFELLEKLQGLLSKGIITQDEFESKKAEILKNIS